MIVNGNRDIRYFNENAVIGYESLLNEFLNIPSKLLLALVIVGIIIMLGYIYYFSKAVIQINKKRFKIVYHFLEVEKKDVDKAIKSS